MGRRAVQLLVSSGTVEDRCNGRVMLSNPLQGNARRFLLRHQFFVDGRPMCTRHDHLLSELTLESNAKSKIKIHRHHKQRHSAEAVGGEVGRSPALQNSVGEEWRECSGGRNGAKSEASKSGVRRSSLCTDAFAESTKVAPRRRKGCLEGGRTVQGVASSQGKCSGSIGSGTAGLSRCLRRLEEDGEMEIEERDSDGEIQQVSPQAQRTKDVLDVHSRIDALSSASLLSQSHAMAGSGNASPDQRTVFLYSCSAHQREERNDYICHKNQTRHAEMCTTPRQRASSVDRVATRPCRVQSHGYNPM